MNPTDANRFAHDPHRPRYHFLPPANWMNDPNGCIQWRGDYHLFYQYTPDRPVSGVKHWGHAVSRDLVHWEHWPIALSPTPGGPDKDGCWSGSAVDHRGVPTLIYTGVSPQVQCIATSADGMRTWHKYVGNPVIAAPPPGVIAKDFRDPYVWHEEDGWHAVIGSGVQDVGGIALLYRSPDLIHWEYLGPLYTGRKEETGTIWECPNFFPLGEKWVLIVSPIPLRRTIYFVGRYADHRFEPELRGEVDLGGHYYAPQTFADERGRRIMWGWLWEGRSREAQIAAGWAGVMSLPRILTLRADGRLGIDPAPEVGRLRGKHRRWSGVRLASGGQLLEVQGNTLEIAAEIRPGAGPVGLEVCRSPQGEERTRVVYDPAVHILTMDRAQASLSPDVQRDAHSTPLALAPGEALRLRIYLDRSVVEVFANGHACLAERIYPTRADSLDVQLFAEGEAVFEVVDVWEMETVRS